jgi:hypothetical protein
MSPEVSLELARLAVAYRRFTRMDIVE